MASNMFIKMIGPDIAGSSTAKGHETHIEVLSWNYGCHQTVNSKVGSGGGLTAEKITQGPLHFTKYIDTASDDLLKMAWTGKHIEKATFVAYRSSGDGGANQMGVQYLKIELDEVVVGDYSISGGQGDIAVENVALYYNTITFTYDPQDQKKGTSKGVQTVKHDGPTNVVS